MELVADAEELGGGGVVLDAPEFLVGRPGCGVGVGGVLEGVVSALGCGFDFEGGGWVEDQGVDEFAELERDSEEECRLFCHVSCALGDISRTQLRR